MDPILATLVLILVALLGARISFSSQRVGLGPRLLFRTGIHFLFLGFLLGPSILGMFGEDAVVRLHALMGLGLGWIGVLFGLQFDRDTVRRFPRRYFVVALGQAVLTFGFCVAVGFLATRVFGLGGVAVSAMIVGAAATAAVSTPAAIAMVSSNFLVRGQVRQFVFFVASVDGVVGITALHLAYAGFHGTRVLEDYGLAGGAFWAFAGLGLGLVCGILFLWVVRLRPGRSELVLYLLGISALVSGGALQLQVSPLFAAMVLGMVTANFTPEQDRTRIYRTLGSWEQPIYVILLLMSGALLTFNTWWVVPLAAAYVVTRGIGKVLSAGLLVSALPLPIDLPRRVGMALMPQGGLSLAMALSLVLVLGPSGIEVLGVEVVPLLFAVVVIGVTVSELAGPLLTIQVLRRAGEISPRVERALREGDEERAEVEALRRHEPAPPPEDQPQDAAP
jgi:Kef-type K+ transport system membrane component KefB